MELHWPMRLFTQLLFVFIIDLCCACSYVMYELWMLLKWHFTVTFLCELDTQLKTVLGIISRHRNIGT
jgi:hypothetical protein